MMSFDPDLPIVSATAQLYSHMDRSSRCMERILPWKKVPYGGFMTLPGLQAESWVSDYMNQVISAP